MSREDWIALAVVLGAVASVGIAVYVLSRRKASPKRVQLKRINEGRVVLRNLERVKMIRDREGNLSEMEIHREVRE